MEENSGKLKIKLSKQERSALDDLIGKLASGSITPEEEIHGACYRKDVVSVQALLAFRPDLACRLSSENMNIASWMRDDKVPGWFECEGLTPLEMIQMMMEMNSEDYTLLEGFFKPCVIEYMLTAFDPRQSEFLTTDRFPKLLPPHLSLLFKKSPAYTVYQIVEPPPDSCGSGSPFVHQVNGDRVLCIDGGGTRGFVPIEILDQIEKCFPQGNRKITDYFDWIVGTSTGGLIALYLSLGYSAADCRKMYFKLKDDIFAGSPPYSVDNLELKLKEVFGPDTKMSAIPASRIRCVITSATIRRETQTPQSIVFTNYDPETMDKYIWEVARCTSAAPYYFNPYIDPETGTLYYDGGLTANNPTLLALDKITQVGRAAEEKSLKNGFVLSLGTGKAPAAAIKRKSKSKSVSSVDFTVSRSWMSQIAVAKRLLIVLLNQVTKTDDEVVQHAVSHCENAECQYVRLNPVLPEPIELDETDNQKLVNMIFHAKAYGNINLERIQNICLNLAPEFQIVNVNSGA